MLLNNMFDVSTRQEPVVDMLADLLDEAASFRASAAGDLMGQTIRQAGAEQGRAAGLQRKNRPPLPRVPGESLPRPRLQQPRPRWPLAPSLRTLL